MLVAAPPATPWSSSHKGRRHPTTLVTMLGLTAVAVAAGLVAATPAHAVIGIQVVEATSATDSVAIKSVTANCPAGGVVYGGGGLAGRRGGRRDWL